MGRRRWELAITIAGLLGACSPAPPSGSAGSSVGGALELTRVSDPKSDAGLSFQVVGARAGVSECSGDVTRFVGAGPDGGDIWHRVTRFGIEDDTEIRTPSTRQLEYRIELEATAGLRLVAGVLELLDGDGTPRLRVGPAFVKDATGRQVAAELALSGCAADRDPRGPWGRKVTAPGATRCQLSVSWQAGLVYPIVVDPPWVNPKAMVATRVDLTATSLANGKVLAAGGVGLKSAELYDPATHTWSPTGDMQQARSGHHAVELLDGRVLMVGAGTATAEIYDPTSGTFTATGSMAVARSKFTANRIQNGKVLVAGGDDGVTGELAACELFDPATGAFTPTGSMAMARMFHVGTTLSDGSVLVIGSIGGSQAERYSPQSGTWSAAGISTYGPGMSASMTTLKDGRALLMGGWFQMEAQPSSSLYDPVQNNWAAGAGVPGAGANAASSDCCTAKPTPGCDTPSTQTKVCNGIGGASCCTTAWSQACVDAVSNGVTPQSCGRRDLDEMLVLEDGRVLVATGEYKYPKLINTPETPLLYFPGAGGPGSWLVTSDPNIDTHQSGALALLPDGNALLVGGFNGTSDESCFTQGCACNTNLECFSKACVDGFCCDTACNGTCEACSAALKGSGADGSCGPIPTSSDPENECTEAAPTSCQTDGFCDGAGACALYANGTKCGPSSCIDTLNENHPSLCDGSGACVEKGNGPCPGGYVCTGDACLTTCVTGSDCQEHYLCVNGACKRLPNGQPCTEGVECDSDQCVDGLCCNDSCDGQCEACDVQDHEGDCTPVSGDPHGARPACESATSGDCASTCNGADPTACKLPGKEKTCGEGKSCDGKGACVQTAAICSADKSQSTALDGTVTKCGLYACDTSTGECGSSCSASNQCSPNAVCDQPKCIASSEGEADEGCGCDLAPNATGRGALLGAMLAFGLWLRRQRRSRAVLLAVAALGCSTSSKDEAPTPSEPVDRTISELAARFPGAGLLSDTRPALLGRAPARVALGTGFDVEDGDTRVGVSVELVGEDTTRPRVQHGSHWLGRGRGPEGSDVLVRVNDAGVEDFVVFERAPARGELEYRIDVSRVPGLRLVDGVLELLDQKGSPRLAVNRPWTLDGKGVRRDATLELRGCEADRDPRVPFERPVTPPNAKSCRLLVKFERDVSYPLLVDPSWTLTTSPGGASFHASAVLADGRLLVCGGPGTSTRIYTNGTFAVTGAMNQLRQGHTATTLDSGLVLAAGGNSNTAETYSVTTGTWTPIGSMASSRMFSRATKLSDGSVLITGGDPAGTAERFIPASNSFQAAGVLGSPRVQHTATLLTDGRVLVAGGGNGTFNGDTTAIVYTLGTGWAATGSMSVKHGAHVAARLGDGRVLVVGGDDPNGFPDQIPDAEIWNPATGTWATTTSLPEGKRFAQAVAFGNGSKVYVVGGRANGTATYIFDVATSAWSNGGSLNIDRWTHTADLLPNGVLMVVGKLPQGGETNPPAEYQCVDYGCACSASTPCLVGSCVDGVCCKTACNGVCEACNAAGKTSGVDGECGPALDGTVDPTCPVEAASTCGTIGTCDAAGACRKHPFGTECAPAACTGPALFQAAASCDGTGNCNVPPVATCDSGYPCVGDACATSCVTNDDCIAPATCNGNVCVKKSNGADCSALTECASGFCVDGKCCNEACTGQCQSCAESGLEGVCTAIDGDPKGNRDACDGAGTECAGTCAKKTPQKCTYPSGSCGDGKTCSNGKCISTANVCVDDNTASQPAVGPKTPCSPYLCANGECLDACATSQDCASGYVCDAKLCVSAKNPAGGGGAEDDGGCGCRTSRSAPDTWTYVLAGLALSMLRRRRRGSREQRE